MRTLSRAVRLRTSRITASQSRAGLNPTPPLPMSASDVSEAADLSLLVLLSAINFVDPPEPFSGPPSPLLSFSLLAKPGSWVWESCVRTRVPHGTNFDSYYLGDRGSVKMDIFSACMVLHSRCIDTRSSSIPHG